MDETLPEVASDRASPRFRTIDPGVTLGRYQVIKELGMGGMATVYRARDTDLRRDVAIKALFPHLGKRPEIVARFQREARAAAALDHPNIVRVYDVGGAPEAGEGPASGQVLDPPYIVMELVRGRSLQQVIQDLGEAPLGEIVAGVGVVLCAALAEAHGAGIVHRDVKPANIMVTESGRLALTDFGVARIEDEDSSLVTRTGALLGTPAFMSPEQAMGAELDGRSDVYSLGATLYRLATGTAPFSGPTARVVTAIAGGDMVPPLRRNPAMGKDLARVIERMMARDPGARYQSAGEAGEALARIAGATGLGEPAAELRQFFADPAAYMARRKPEVAQATLAQARDAAGARALPRAMALADRVLALAPDGPVADQALALVAALGQGQRRAKWLIAGCAALLVAAAAVVGMWWAGSPAGAPVLAGGEYDAAVDAGVVDADLSERMTTRFAAASGLAADAAGLPADQTGQPAGQQSGPGERAAGERAFRPVSGQRAPGSRQSRVRDSLGHDRSGKGKSGGKSGEGRGGDKSGEGSEASGAMPDASVPRPVPDAAPARASVTLDLRPWCDVRIDGKAFGRASRDRVISLSPGTHQVVCSQGPGRAEWRKTITLKPGQRMDLSGSVLRPVRVIVSLKRGDRVVIQERSHENGARLSLPPGRYRMDVMAGTRRVGGAWVSVPVVPACTVRDQPALDCYP